MIVRWDQRLRQEARFSVLDSDTACGETSYRTLEIELLPSTTGGRAVIQLNGNSSNWDTLETILHDVYLTRAEKFIYLRVGPGVNSLDESEMFHLIERGGVERLCLLDPKAPHKYTERPPSAP